jgi:hypothetical protein
LGEVPAQIDTQTRAVAIYVDAPRLSIAVPAPIADAGERAAHTNLEFVTARIANAHTCRADGRAGLAFCSRCERELASLAQLSAPTVSAYVAGLRDGADGLSLASIKLTASGSRTPRISPGTPTRAPCASESASRATSPRRKSNACSSDLVQPAGDL